MSVTPEQGGQDVWLWREHADLRWWTPGETGLLNDALPASSTVAVPAVVRLRDEGVELAVEQVLPDALASCIDQQLRRVSGGLALHLCEDLPDFWQALPIQWMRSGGRPLCGQVLPVRYAPRHWRPYRRLTNGRVVVLDLWNETDSDRRLFRDIAEPVSVDVIRGARLVDPFLELKDLSTFDVACIVAHGSESSDRWPVRLHGAGRWALPENERMPLVVMLLVCGGEDGNLVAYGRQLMQRGAAAVLAPVGRLDAGAADRFLRLFLDGWHNGDCLGDIVLAAQQDGSAQVGARRLELLGRTDVRCARASGLNSHDDNRLGQMGFSDTTSLRTLIERITFRSYQDAGDLSESAVALFHALGFEYGSPEAEEQVLAVLEPCLSDLPALSRAWALPLVASLSESYEHGHLQRRLSEYMGERVRLPRSPFTHYAWGKVFNRLGRVEDASQELVSGFELLDPDNLCPAGGAAVVGQLTNVLIDLNLPEPGEILYRKLLAPCLARRGDSLVDRFRPNRMDRAGRLALRAGRPGEAFSYFARRRQEAVDSGRSDMRDLAWLSYVAAWLDDTPGQKLIDEALARIERESSFRAGIGRGNESEVHLLRAVAAWCWRRGDGAAAGVLGPFLAELAERLSAPDPGPYAEALGFARLALEAGVNIPGRLPEWIQILLPLQETGQWLDSAILAGFAGRPEAAAEALEGHQAMRRLALGPLSLLPGWAIPGGAGAWAGWAEAASRRESGVLLDGARVSAEAAARNGILPM